MTRCEKGQNMRLQDTKKGIKEDLNNDMKEDMKQGMKDIKPDMKDNTSSSLIHLCLFMLILFYPRHYLNHAVTRKY